MKRSRGITDLWSQLSTYLSRSIVDYSLGHLKAIVIISTPLLLIVTLLVGWIYARKVRETVVADFNQQQLLLAKHAASQVEDSLNHLKRELSLLSVSLTRTYKTFGEKKALAEIKNHPDTSKGKSLAYAFLLAFGKGTETKCQYSKDEVEYGEFLKNHARKLLDVKPEEYSVVLQELLTACGSSETVPQ